MKGCIIVNLHWDVNLDDGESLFEFLFPSLAFFLHSIFPILIFSFYFPNHLHPQLLHRGERTIVP
jgi:hypothetical protein